MNAPKEKSSLGEMRASIRRLNEKAELLAAQTVLARNEEEPETESQRLLNAHARVRAAIAAATAKMVSNADRIRRRHRRRALIELDPLNAVDAVVEEALHAQDDAATETEPEGQ